jgi:acetylornithine deacetylase/succinyl-diaminopimelate desuccinylase-like protein
MTSSSLLRAIPLAGVCLVCAVPATAQQSNGAPKAIVERADDDVRILADDRMEGRGVGTAGLDSAAAYLAERFAAVGLEPAGDDGFFQHFSLDPSAPALAHSNIGAADVRNVVGVLPGRGALADEIVIVGAHYDHLGLGGSGSLDPDSTGVVHNGADDNASGTAALLATAQMLAARDVAERRTFMFVAFTAEELGLLGSEHFVRHPTRDLSGAYAMINYDMVGRLSGDSLMVIGTGSAEEFADIVDEVNTSHGLALTTTTDPWGRSDHSSFYAQGIPVVHFFTNTHEDYHRTTDDWPLINTEGLVQVAALGTDLAWHLGTRTDALTYVEVEAPAPATGGGYGAWLGSIPDMTESPGGVRLTGVRAGSPAEEAGIQAGDIIVQIGTYEVRDLYAMTDALRSYRPDDRVVVAVMRDGERIEMNVTLGKRGG